MATVARAYAQPASLSRTRLRWPKDGLRLSLFLFVVANISRVHQYISLLGRLHLPLLLACMAFLAALLDGQVLRDWSWTRRWPPKVLLALGIVACVSAFFGMSLGHSARFLMQDYLKLLLSTFLLMAVLRRAEDVYMFVWAYVVSSAILVFVAVFLFRLSAAAPGDLARLGELQTYDANDLGCVLVVGLVLSVLAFQTSRGLAKAVSLATIGGIGVALARSGSRGAFLGAVVVGLLLLTTLNRVAVWKRVAFVAVAALGLGLAAPHGYWRQMETVVHPQQDYNWTDYNGRKAIAERAWGYWKMYPVFGVGIGNFPMAEGLLSTRGKEFQQGMAGIKWSAAHNSFIQAGTELGPAGLVLWCALVFGGIGGMLRLRRRLPKAWARGDASQRFLYAATLHLPIALAGFAVTGFFVSFAWMDPLYVLTALVTGVYVSATARLRMQTRRLRRRATARLGAHARMRSFASGTRSI